MKKRLLFFLAIIFVSACRSAWNQTNEQTFYNACLDDAKTWAGSPEQAAAYCNCVIPKVKQKYPDENEAMKKIDSLSVDKDLQSCRDSIMKK